MTITFLKYVCRATSWEKIPDARREGARTQAVLVCTASGPNDARNEVGGIFNTKSYDAS